MDYTLTEDEYNQITSTRLQLRMLGLLMCATGADQNVDADGLSEFLGVHQSALLKIEEDVEARRLRDRVAEPQDEQSGGDFTFSAQDFMDLMAALSGAPLPHERIGEISLNLMNTQPDYAASPVFRAFVEGMKRRGLDCSVLIQSGQVQACVRPTAKVPPRKREKLAAASVAT